MVFSTRTIFLFIRGIDQTGRALTDPTKKLTEMELAQQRLAQSGYRLLFAGAAFLAFGAMAAGALFKIVEKSSIGARVINDFGKVFDRFQRGLSEAIIRNYGVELKKLLDTIDSWVKNPENMNLLAGILVTITTITFALGPTLIAAGVTTMLLSKILPLFAQAGFLATATATAIAGTVGAAILTLGFALVLEITIKDIIWNILPTAVQKSIQDIDQKMRDITGLKGSLFDPQMNANNWAKTDLANLGAIGREYGPQFAGPQTAALANAVINIYQYITGGKDVGEQVGDSTVDAMTDILGNVK